MTHVTFLTMMMKDKKMRNIICSFISLIYTNYKACLLMLVDDMVASGINSDILGVANL